MLSPSLRWRAFGQCLNQSASVVIERDGAEVDPPKKPAERHNRGRKHRGLLPNTTTRTPSAEPPTGVKHLRRRR
jgi:hypothetical protein